MPDWLKSFLIGLVAYLKGFVDGQEAMAKKIAKKQKERKDALEKEFKTIADDGRSLDDAIGSLRNRAKRTHSGDLPGAS